MNTKISTVVFDFDGTLADSFTAICNLVNNHAEEYSYKKASDEEIQELRDYSARDVIKYYGIPKFKLISITVRLRKEFSSQIPQLQTFKGIKELLEQLKGKGVTIGIVSSNSTENIQQFLINKEMNLFDFIDGGVGLFGKSIALRRMIQRHHLDKKTLLYVGDEIRDIEACKKVGIRIASVCWGANTKSALSLHEPDFLVERPEEILEIVDKSYSTSL